MRDIRKSISSQIKDNKVSGREVRKSIERASMSFQLEDGTEAGDIVIENERLKNTLQIMN